jgi:hypothetical protein
MADTSGFEVGDVVKVSSSAGTENALVTVVHANVHLTVAALYLDHTTTTPVVSLASTLYVERAYTNDPASGANIELNMADTTGFAVGDLVEVSSSAGRENATVTVVHVDTHLTVNTLALNHTTTSPMVKQVVQNTFIVDTSGDLSATLSVGMKLKFTDSTVKYGILHAIATTRLTIYTGTDYSIVSTGALSDTFYSMVKTPFGFPLNTEKWTVQFIDNKLAVVTPSANIWYNPLTLFITIPVGSWRVIYMATGEHYKSGDTGYKAFYVTLSTANNTESDKDFTATSEFTTTQANILSISKEKNLSISSKANYYLNISTWVATASTTLGFRGDSAKTIILAVDAYL